MAAPVPLDPGAHTGTYKRIGGRPVLDFANLVSYRGTPREHDWLDPIDNLQRWIDAASLDARVPERIDDLIALREALASVLLAVAEGRDPRGPEFTRVATAAQDARARQRLHWDATSDRAVWRLTRPSLADVLALDAVDLLTDDAARGRLGVCGECGWLYLDTTRNRSRRWCDPADCGNRARQRRHYRRRRNP